MSRSARSVAGFWRPQRGVTGGSNARLTGHSRTTAAFACRTHAGERARTRECTHAHVHSAHVLLSHMLAYTRTSHARAYMHEITHAYTHTYACMHTRARTYASHHARTHAPTHVRTHACMHAQMYIVHYIHLDARIHTHTHTHSHTATHACMLTDVKIVSKISIYTTVIACASTACIVYGSVWISRKCSPTHSFVP